MLCLEHALQEFDCFDLAREVQGVLTLASALVRDVLHVDEIHDLVADLREKANIDLSLPLLREVVKETNEVS